MTLQNPHGLIPEPVRSTPQDAGRFVLGSGAWVLAAPELRLAARQWVQHASSAFGIDLALSVVPAPVKATGPEQGSVRFHVDAELPAGGYAVRVDHGGITIRARDLDGAHNATRTLQQLAGPQAFRQAPLTARPEDPAYPFVDILDNPRMQWRGVLLDVARHFLPKNGVLRFIDLAAAHKLNVVQLHLTDDQGWRMQINKYPRLTEVGGWRAESAHGVWQSNVYDGQPHGGFYTQDDLREIVSYARDRGVVVVPEIDVPGHVEAAVAAYPELGTRKTPHQVRTTWGMSTEVLDPSDESLAFFRNVLDEVIDVFDSPWIGIGGDEVPTLLWRESEQIVARAKDLGLQDVAELHGWFLGQLSEHLLTQGRRPVVWDEGFGPWLPREAIVMSWRGYAAGLHAMRAGHDVVMAPEQVVYLDHRAGDHADEPTPVGFLSTIADLYAFEPLPAALLDAFPAAEKPEVVEGELLGIQAEVWTEHLDSQRRIDFATYPRLVAFAEVAWSPETSRPVDGARSQEFLNRLETSHLPRLDAAGVEYRPLAGPHPWQSRPGAAGLPRDRDAEAAQAGWAGAGGWRDDVSVDPRAQE